MPLLSIEQVAEELGVSERTARQLVADGDLRALRIGRRVLVRPADLDEFVDDRVTRETVR